MTSQVTNQVKGRCFACGVEFSFGFAPGRREECPKCGADVHVCLNCKNYDKNAYNECREPQGETVKEKARANFCDYFELAGAGSGANGYADQLLEQQKALQAAAEALFKKKT